MLNPKESKSRQQANSSGNVALHFGAVTQVDETKGRVKVQLPDLGIESWWLQILVRRSSSDKHVDWLDIGDTVAVLLDERGEAGVVLGAIYSDSNPPPIADIDTWYRLFEGGGSIKYERAIGTLTIEGMEQITIKGDRIDLNPD